MYMESCCSMKGFLTFIVLRLISKKDMSGEEIRKRKGTRPSPGTIYPVLKYLNKSGFIEAISSKGKTKRYKVTKKGKKELNEATKKFCMLFYDMKEDIGRSCYR